MKASSPGTQLRPLAPLSLALTVSPFARSLALRRGGCGGGADRGRSSWSAGLPAASRAGGLGGRVAASTWSSVRVVRRPTAHLRYAAELTDAFTN